MTNNRVYILSDGRIWDIAQAAYVEEVPAGFEAVKLSRPEGAADEAYLIRTLEFYNYPLGELGPKSASWIKARLADLDAQYLPPRTLAALARGDATAYAMFVAHEEAADVWREQLARLEGRQFIRHDPATYEPVAESGNQDNQDAADNQEDSANPASQENQENSGEAV